MPSAPRTAVVVLLMAIAALTACKPRGHERAEARLVHGGRVRMLTYDVGPASGPDSEAARATGGTRSAGAASAASDAVAGQARLTPPDADSGKAPDAGRESPKVDADPDRFLGTSPRKLETELGSPVQVRREPPAEIWQYRDSQCVLDLFLYPGENGPAVTHIEARDPTAEPVPLHLRNAPTQLMKDEGYGAGYDYDHDAEDAFSGQNYFPDDMERRSFYAPVERGFERDLKKRLEYFARLRDKRET